MIQGVVSGTPWRRFSQPCGFVNSKKVQLSRQSLVVCARRKAESPPPAEVAEEVTTVQQPYPTQDTLDAQQQYWQQQQQQQQYYQQQQAPPPMYGAYPVVQKPANTGPPWFVWIFIGVLISQAFSWVKGMASMVGMMRGAGGGGSSGQPDLSSMMKMMQEMQGGAGGAGGAAGGTTFEQRRQEGLGGNPPNTSAPSSTGQATYPVVDSEVVNQGGNSTTSSASTGTTQSSGMFTDVTASKPDLPDAPPNMPDPPQSTNSNNPMSDIDPESLKQFLPPHLQDSDLIKQALNDPQYSKEIEKQMNNTYKSMSDAGNGEYDDMMNKLKGAGFSQEKMMKKLMEDPEVIGLLQKPHVAQAFMSMQKNPATIMDYQKDPDVKKIMNKLQSWAPQLFS